MNIEKIKLQLLQEKKELDTRLQKIGADLGKGHSPDSSEQAQERENDEVLDELGREAQEQLQNINRAIEKINNNHYGLCERCDQNINQERLEAIPTAQYCLQCAE